MSYTPLDTDGNIITPESMECFREVELVLGTKRAKAELQRVLSYCYVAQHADEPLSGAFNFARTPQGKKFWNGVVDSPELVRHGVIHDDDGTITKVITLFVADNEIYVHNGGYHCEINIPKQELVFQRDNRIAQYENLFLLPKHFNKFLEFERTTDDFDPSFQPFPYSDKEYVMENEIAKWASRFLTGK